MVEQKKLKLGDVVMLDKRTKINYIIKKKHLCITNKIFDENICQFLSDLSKNLLKVKESKLYPDLYAFAYWCRTSNIKRYKKNYQTGRI